MPHVTHIRTPSARPITVARERGTGLRHYIPINEMPARLRRLVQMARRTTP